MTKERADEICEQAKAAGKGRCYYDWMNHLHEFMTPTEEQEVKALWSRMPGWTCWWDAFNRFRLGTATDESA